MSVSEESSRLSAIRSAFAGILGRPLVGYETAELLLEDGSRSAWPDLPIRLRTDTGSLVAISWSNFDDLWLANDDSLPFALEDAVIRWVPDAVEALRPALGQTIRSVALGQGEMTWDGVEKEIWTRLLIGVGDGFVEVFNALDENGYAWHAERPALRSE